MHTYIYIYIYIYIYAGVLQGDTLAPYLFIISLDYMLWMLVDLMKENGFMLAKARSRRYHAWMITDAGYADDIALCRHLPPILNTIQIRQVRHAVLYRRNKGKLIDNIFLWTSSNRRARILIQDVAWKLY